MADSLSLLTPHVDFTGRPDDWLVICDFDGTIAQVDVTDGILGRFALPEWEEVEVEWKAGRIGSRECMARQVALVRAQLAELDAYLDTVVIDPDFAAFVADCRTLQLPVMVISDGIDYAIHRILRRHGLDRLTRASNRLVQLGGNRYQLEFPDSNPHCRAGSGTCKCAVSNAPAHGCKRLLIGDGSSDFCLAGEADLVFAKSKLLLHCQQKALRHRACPDFAAARQLLSELDLPARPAYAPPPRARRAHPVAANAVGLKISVNG